MSEDSELQDNEKERRTNTRLAVAIGVIGLGALGAFYLLFFLMIILRPGLLFSVMPSPEIATSALSDGNRTYLLIQKVDMSTVSPREKRQPEIKHYLAALAGTDRGEPLEVPPYARAIGSQGRIVFLFKGGYRTYAGGRLTEVRSDAIGADPRAALSSSGLYVLSSFADGYRLTLVRDGTVTPVPLPEEFLEQDGEDSCPCSQIVWYRGQLCLFWSTGDGIAWTAWNGAAWEPVVLSPLSGSFQVMAGDRELYFFIRDTDASDAALQYYVFADNAWTGPTSLPLPPGCTDWNVFLQEGRPHLFTQRFPAQMLQTIDHGNLIDAVRLPGPFHPGRLMGRIALFGIASNLLTILAIFGISAFVRRYKNRFWTEGDSSYEFASLFRRFLAYLIDTLVLLLPSAIAIGLFFSREDFGRNPLLPVMLILAAVVFYFLGGFLYHALLEGLLGQTLGKKVCGIVVLKADFTPCTLSAGFLRNLLRIVDAFFYYLVASVVLAATFKWQRLGDMAADTVVVRKR